MSRSRVHRLAGERMGPKTVVHSRRWSPFHSPQLSDVQPPHAAQVWDDAEELLKQAQRAEDAHDTQLAQALYEQSTEMLLAATRTDTSEAYKSRMRERATFALDRAEKLATQASAASSSAWAPPALHRGTSQKHAKIAQIRAVTGDAHSDDSLRVLLAKHADDVEAVINEIFEEMIADVQTSFGASSGGPPPSALSRQASGHLERTNASVMEVTCPDGVRGGDQVSFQTPAGAWMEVGVPEGVRPGDVFPVALNAPPPTTAAHPPDPAMWVCGQCTLENRLEEATCAACDTPRSGQSSAAAAAGARAARAPLAAPPAPVARSATPNVVVPPREPSTIEEFLTSDVAGAVKMRMQLLLPSGRMIQVERAMPAATMRTQLVYIVGGGLPPPGGRQVHPDDAVLPPEQLPARPVEGARGRGKAPRGHLQPTDATGRPEFSIPSANQGAFGGERVGLPAHSSRQASKLRGPPQRGVEDKLTVDEMRSQLGDGALESAIKAAMATNAAKGGVVANAHVNPDISEDRALYDDGVGGQFERSVYIDPNRDKRGKGPADIPLAERKVEVMDGSAAGVDGAVQLPVAYEVAAVGARIANMSRVGGQRVMEMDHFVESTSTPIVRLTLPGEDKPESSRSALLAARKVLETKLVTSASANAPTVDLGGGAPSLRVLTALGDHSTGAPPPPHAKLYGQLMWGVLVEVVEKVMGRKKATEVIGGLYYMPTVRANVFVCSPSDDRSAALHVNVLVFEQSLVCECDGDDPTKPLRVAPNKWRHLLPYWLCRITGALNEANPGTVKGMYDESTRKRLVERVKALGGAQAVGAQTGGGCVNPLAFKPQKWKPPPLPTEVLTKG